MGLNKYIDHTILKATASGTDVQKLCEEAIEHEFYSVCVNGCYVVDAKHLLQGTDVKIAAVVGFPLGAMTTAAKIFEAKEAVENGASEIDMVINVAKLKDGEFEYVENEIRQIKEAIGDNVLKVIIETCYLTDSEKVALCKCITNGGADYIKTSTGFGSGGASLEDIRLFKKHIGPNVKIKAAGGIRSISDMKAYIAEGCSRIGASAAVELLKDHLDEEV